MKMPVAPDDLARAAISTARYRATDEPAIIHNDRRYPETELRALAANGNLQALGDAESAALQFLGAIDAARQPTAPDPLHVCTLATDATARVEYLLPAGWKHTHIVLRQVPARQEIADADQG
jgi:hypothetical protein